MRSGLARRAELERQGFFEEGGRATEDAEDQQDVGHVGTVNEPAPECICNTKRRTAAPPPADTIAARRVSAPRSSPEASIRNAATALVLPSASPCVPPQGDPEFLK